MRKVLTLIMTIAVLVSTFWFSAGLAGAAGLITYRGALFVQGKGIVFVFEASGYRNRDVRGATIFAGSNFHDLGCTVNGEGERIVCVLRGGLTRYAGQTGVIYLGGQVFYVTIPDRGAPEEVAQEEALVCDDLESMGAWVTFEYFEGEFYSGQFIEGDSQDEVEAQAAAAAAQDSSITHYEVGEFGCWEVNEQIPQ